MGRKAGNSRFLRPLRLAVNPDALSGETDRKPPLAPVEMGME